VEVLVDLLIDAESDGDEKQTRRYTLNTFLEEQTTRMRTLVDDRMAKFSRRVQA
jgi:hypothetical protein